MVGNFLVVSVTLSQLCRL